MVEFISNRIIDTNGLQQRCRQYLSEYNQVILDQLKNQTQKPSSGYWFLMLLAVYFSMSTSNMTQPLFLYK